MDRQREKTHLIILNSRVKSLGEELEAAIKLGKITDERIKALQDGINMIHSNRQDRLQEIEAKFETELNDQKKQIQLAQDVLEKKKEERHALMGYLSGLDLEERSLEDLREFEWDSLQRIAENQHRLNEDLVAQTQKAEVLNDQLQKAKLSMTQVNEILTSTGLVKDRFSRTWNAFTTLSDAWISIRSSQESRINKLQSDNERLNVLMKQCLSANEHMVEHITKNVQAKCQSFLNSESTDELIEGLKKFKARQDRVIDLLQHKDNQLGSETNKLEVAKDQTHDQLRFYSELIANRRSTHLGRIIGSQAMAQLPAYGA
jgi:hypothetical protein